MSIQKASTPVWFITGCSTGLGRALAMRVLARDHRCVVMRRDASQVADIVGAYPDASLALALDVTDDAQRRAAVTQAEVVTRS